MARLETGVVQCGDDWPGIFIRGDDAFFLLQSITHVLAAMPSEPTDFYTALSAKHLESFAKMLGLSNVHGEGHHVEQTVTLNITDRSQAPSGG